MLRKNKLTKNIIQEQVKVKALKALFCLVIKIGTKKFEKLFIIHIF